MSKKNDFFDQLGLVFNLAGQFMLAFGLYELIDNWISRQFTLYFFSLFIIQCVLVVAMPNFLSRLLSCWFGLISLLFAFASYGIIGLSAAIVTVGFVLIWMTEVHWGKYRNLLEPIGYGFALSLIHFTTESAFGIDLKWFVGKQSSNWVSLYSYWISLFLFSTVTIWFLFKIAQQNELALRSKSGALVIAGGGLLILIGAFIPGVSGALLLLLVGFSISRPVLVGLGILTVIGFISWYYYNLNLTLLNKSIILMTTGSVLFISIYLLKKYQLLKLETQGLISKSNSSSSGGSDSGSKSFLNESPDAKSATCPLKPLVIKVKWVVACTILLSLMLVNLNIYKKEMVLDNGQLVLLELAPIDPRSLIQGDYMRLRFELETQLIKRDEENSDDSQQSLNHLVVNLNEKSVATFSHLYQGEKLKDSQVKMQYRMRKGSIYLATHAFFFQEGTAKEYENAKYGEFRVAKNGELLLNSLRDESLNVIGFNRPEN